MTTTIEFVPTGIHGPEDTELMRWVVEVKNTLICSPDEILDAFLQTVRQIDEKAAVKVTANYGDRVTSWEF